MPDDDTLFYGSLEPILFNYLPQLEELPESDAFLESDALLAFLAFLAFLELIMSE